MVDLEALARRARRAAEWGRLRVASRICLLVVPIALLALLVGPGRGAIIGIGLALLGASVTLGWWSAEGARAARSGVTLGAIPMMAGLITVAVEGWCDPNRAVTLCGLGCLVAGFVAGGGSAWYAVRSGPARRIRAWGEIGLVASLTTALGCAGLGLGSALAVIGAMAAGAAIAWRPARVRA
jgi:hypothetical protein